MNRLPEYYYGVPEIDELFENLKNNSEHLSKTINKLKKEIYIPSSSFEGLKIWSETLDVINDKNSILVKIRGARTITKKQLAIIVRDILKQDVNVEVTEFNNIYRVYLGVHVPGSNIEEVQNYLRKELKLIIPSHIELYLYFNAMIWVKFNEYNKTWAQWDALDLTWEQLEKYNESIRI